MSDINGICSLIGRALVAQCCCPSCGVLLNGWNQSPVTAGFDSNPQDFNRIKANDHTATPRLEWSTLPFSLPIFTFSHSRTERLWVQILRLEQFSQLQLIISVTKILMKPTKHQLCQQPARSMLFLSSLVISQVANGAYLTGTPLYV